jgi:phosphoenolpyruvate carboxylase
LRQWPFFRTLLSNGDMVLAKSDSAIAARYAKLVKDWRASKRIFAPPSKPSGDAPTRRSN